MDKLIATSAADLERVRELSALLADALALPLHARDPWLLQLAPRQRRLEPALRGLLARAAVDTSSFMRRSVEREALAAIGCPAASERPGQRVGPYRLVREIGRGGMATVWLAERDDCPARQAATAHGLAGPPETIGARDPSAPDARVALKLARPAWSNGFDTHMARERDIVAALDHPHIARLLDAGADDSGRHYLALDYVDGIAIDAYLRERGSDTAECLHLMRQLMSAVAHVHAAGIVHNDLKPANIVVDRAGRVRLIDFGVADRLQAGTAASVPRTLGGGRACTPAYASPEQRRGEPLGVASDIHALGVVLHELLCGRRPPVSDAAFEPAPVARLGARLEAGREAVLDAALEPAPEQDRPERDDLGAILARALQPDAARRYPSVERFAADLERWRIRGDTKETRLTAGRRHAVTQASYPGAVLNPEL